MKNVAKNFFYQALFQVTKIILPIITVPIVSDAIGPKGIGAYNYTNSIAQYFILFAGLGVGLYGNREIALAWNRKEHVSRTFWEIVTFKGVLSILSFLLYLTLISFFSNKVFFYVQSLAVLSVLFDISWFFMGIQDFKKTSLASLLTQIASFVLILLFVRSENDTLVYIAIQTFNIVFPQVFVWIFAKSYIHFEKVSIYQSFKHFPGALSFFIPQVAILLYTNLNKTLLGSFLGEKSVGFYTNALTLNTVFITIITTLDTVMLPHMSGLFAKNNIKRIIDTMKKTIHIQLFFSIAIMFGMLTVFDKLVPWFFGNKFLFVNQIIPFFSVLIIINPLGTSISRQYLLPIGNTRDYNISVIIGAVINIVGNIILLPTIGFYGVVFSYISAELFVTIVRTTSFIRVTGFEFEKKKLIVYFISGVIMCLLTRFVTADMNSTVFTNIVQVFIAVPIYFLITQIFKVNPILDLIKKRQ